jgi:hypothetical protein
MYVTGITFIRYVTGITFIRYVTGITFIRYVTGITFIRYAQNNLHQVRYPRLSSDPFKKQQRIPLKADRVLKPISGPPSLI